MFLFLVSCLDSSRLIGFTVRPFSYCCMLVRIDESLEECGSVGMFATSVTGVVIIEWRFRFETLLRLGDLGIFDSLIDNSEILEMLFMFVLVLVFTPL